MRKWISAFIGKYGEKLCTFALALATVTVTHCRGIYYQPKEPDNFQAFVRNHSTNNQ